MVCHFSLRVSGELIQLNTAVPARPASVGELLPAIREISGELQRVAVNRVEREGKHVSCRAGCGACCRQIVPVSEPEARVLAQLVESLPPERRDRVKRRFRDALAALDAAGLLDHVRDFKGSVPPADRRTFALKYFAAGVPCPFLEDESCGIHPDRPISCREYLVTSPAAQCSDPAPGLVEMLPLTAKLSEVLYRFGDGEGRDPHRFLPLVIALEWAATDPGNPPTPFPGPQLLENFVRQMAA
ncbi:MAG: hypothetical protein JWP63_4375 [Candidatus Solibacter sp.]|nr:hypothetical protein [Candidatus Solibacter sp.]